MKIFLALTVGGDGGGLYSVSVPSQIATLNQLSLTHIIQWALYIAITVTIILSLVFLILGGVKWMLSQGDKKQVEEAQKTITYAIIGLIVVFASFFIINLIGYAFGVPLIGNPVTGQ